MRLNQLDIIKGDTINVNFRLRGGTTAHPNPSNPIREINGTIVSYQNQATQNPTCLPTLLQHSLMIKIYPFEYTRLSFDQCSQDSKQEVFEATKRMLAQQ